MATAGERFLQAGCSSCHPTNSIKSPRELNCLNAIKLLLLLIGWSAWTVWASHETCRSIPSLVIVPAPLRSLPHHFKMSSIHLRAGLPGRRSPSAIPNNTIFNSRPSGILQICPNSWSFLFWIVSATVSFSCTTVVRKSDLSYGKKQIVGRLLASVCTYIVAGRVLGRGRLDGVRNEAENGADPQQNGEPAKHLLAELEPLGCRLGRTELVGSVASQNCFSTLRC